MKPLSDLSGKKVSERHLKDKYFLVLWLTDMLGHMPVSMQQMILILFIDLILKRGHSIRIVDMSRHTGPVTNAEVSVPQASCPLWPLWTLQSLDPCTDVHINLILK